MSCLVLLELNSSLFTCGRLSSFEGESPEQTWWIWMCPAWSGVLWWRVSVLSMLKIFSIGSCLHALLIGKPLAVTTLDFSLWHTWFDRDLGISGRVLVRTVDPETQKEKIEQHLVRIHKPLARVSTLCIHLQTAEERGAFKVNKEEHLSPILGTSTLLEAAAGKQLNQSGGSEDCDAWKKGQEPALLRLIASELGIEAKQIANFELGLFDCQPASLGGITNEFLYSARLDNLATVFVALESIVDHSKSEDLAEDDMISLIACFDHEEIGSSSAMGAGSPVMSEGEPSSFWIHFLSDHVSQKYLLIIIALFHAISFPSCGQNHGVFQ